MEIKDKISLPGLIEKSGEVGTSVINTASTTGSTIIQAILSIRLRTGCAVFELIIDHAPITLLADKDTSIKITHTFRSENCHGPAVHVRQLAHIVAALLFHGILAPGLGDLPVYILGIGVDGGPGTCLTVCEADGNTGAVGKKGGDQRLLDIDPGSLNAPDEEEQILAGLIAKFISVRTIVAEPDTIVGCVRVETG